MANAGHHARAAGTHSRARGVTLTKAQLEAWSAYTAPAWQPFKDAWFARGLRTPPTEKQRRVLWEIADARPNDLATWVIESTSRRPDRVVEYVLRQWNAFRDQLGQSLEEQEELWEARKRAARGRAPIRLSDLLRR